MQSLGDDVGLFVMSKTNEVGETVGVKVGKYVGLNVGDSVGSDVAASVGPFVG